MTRHPKHYLATLLKITFLIALFAISIILLRGVPRADADPVAFFQSFAGNIDFQMTGASLILPSRRPNDCQVVDSRAAALVNIPDDATIRAAYLYWAGSGDTPDNQVVFQDATTTATRTFTEVFNSDDTDYHFFSGFADVTAQITGNGTYTLSGLTVNTGDPHCPVQAVVAGWGLLVIYEHADEPLRVINIYDGFQFFYASRVVLNPTNFQIPEEGCDTLGDCKLGVLTWEGDAEISSELNGFTENLFINTTALTNPPANPLNNQFNSTIDLMGTRPNPPGRNTFGIDIDIYSPLPLSDGDTSASTIYQSGGDLVLLSAEILSVLNTPVADLAVTKSHTGDFIAGQQETYTIETVNSGPNDATGTITITDTLPTGLSYVSAAGTGWSCSASGQEVTCTHPGPLANGSALPDLTLTVYADASAASTVTNIVSVAGTTFDNQAGNDSATDITTVLQPDISIAKTVSTISNPVEGATSAKAIPGAILEYRIVVTNTGAQVQAADSVVITDPLPDNLRLVLNDPIAPVAIEDNTSGLSLDPSDVGDNSAPQPLNDVALSNDGGSNFLPLESINPSSGLDATSPKINFIRINPKGTFLGSSGEDSDASFTLVFRVQLE
ncbi:MAG: hypothetical protein PVH22_14835 [Desulfobacteraceae bacterium]|jgi:uncharacterized repeat protein (TIGR01451 family)